MIITQTVLNTGEVLVNVVCFNTLLYIMYNVDDALQQM